MSFPRDDHETLYDTSEYDTFKLFESMKTEFKTLTLSCKIRSPSRDHRTTVRITQPMREKMGDGRTRWQGVVAEFGKTLQAMPDGTQFDVIVFEEKITTCFGKPARLSKATRRKASSPS